MKARPPWSSFGRCSRVRNRVSFCAPIAALGGVLGLCCGLLLLLSLGVLGAAAGLSLQSWALIGAGLVLAAVGLARLLRRHNSRDPSCDICRARASQERPPDESLDTATKGTTREPHL